MKKIGYLAIAIAALLVFAAPADARQRDRSGPHLLKSAGVSHSVKHHRFRSGAHPLRRDSQFRRHHRSGDRFRDHHFRHPHVRHGAGVRFFFGFGPVWPHYRAYAPPPVIIHRSPPPPPVYIQQEPHYWYYCADLKAYYPYVPECPGGWMRVVPHEPR